MVLEWVLGLIFHYFNINPYLGVQLHFPSLFLYYFVKILQLQCFLLRVCLFYPIVVPKNVKFSLQALNFLPVIFFTLIVCFQSTRAYALLFYFSHILHLMLPDCFWAVLQKFPFYHSLQSVIFVYLFLYCRSIVFKPHQFIPRNFLLARTFKSALLQDTEPFLLFMFYLSQFLLYFQQPLFPIFNFLGFLLFFLFLFHLPFLSLSLLLFSFPIPFQLVSNLFQLVYTVFSLCLFFLVLTCFFFSYRIFIQVLFLYFLQLQRRVLNQADVKEAQIFFQFILLLFYLYIHFSDIGLGSQQTICLQLSIFKQLFWHTLYLDVPIHNFLLYFVFDRDVLIRSGRILHHFAKFREILLDRRFLQLIISPFRFIIVTFLSELIYFSLFSHQQIYLLFYLFIVLILYIGLEFFKFQKMDKNYYHTLGIPRSATPSQISDSFRRLAMVWHPKLSKEPLETSQYHFDQICEAFEVLNDPIKRAFFDKFGWRKLTQQLYQDAGLKGGYKFANNSQQIFNRFFGSTQALHHTVDLGLNNKGSLFNHGFGGINYKDKLIRPDLVLQVSCTLSDLYKGAGKIVKFTRQSLNLDGRTLFEKHQQKLIQILPGYSKDTVLRYKNEGNETIQRITSDLVCKIKQEPNDLYTRSGNDLIYTAKITLVQALKCEPLQIITLDDRKIRLSLDEIPNPQTLKEVEGEGMPISGSKKKGNLYVQFDIHFPKSLSQQAKSELRENLIFL